MTSRGPAVSPAGLTALTPAPPGPGFFEIGEELALAPTPGRTAHRSRGRRPGRGRARDRHVQRAPCQPPPRRKHGHARVQDALARNTENIRTRRARCQHGKGRERPAARIRRHGRVAGRGSAVLCRRSRRPAPRAAAQGPTARPAPPAQPQKTVKRYRPGEGLGTHRSDRRRATAGVGGETRNRSGLTLFDCPERMPADSRTVHRAPGRDDDDPVGQARTAPADGEATSRPATTRALATRPAIPATCPIPASERAASMPALSAAASHGTRTDDHPKGELVAADDRGDTQHADRRGGRQRAQRGRQDGSRPRRRWPGLHRPRRPGPVVGTEVPAGACSTRPTTWTACCSATGWTPRRGSWL